MEGGNGRKLAPDPASGTVGRPRHKGKRACSHKALL